MVGSSFPYSEFLPTEGQAKAIQIDLAARNLSIRYPMDLALVGDAKDTLAELLPLAASEDGPLLAGQDRREGQRAVVALMDERASPRTSTAASAPRACSPPSPAICPTTPSCRRTRVSGQLVRPPRQDPAGMKASLSGNLATMVPGVPYAIAAKFAFPDRVAVAMVGDGAMQMGGMAEMLTAAKYYKTWADPRLWCSCSTTRISTRSPGSSGPWRATPASTAARPSPMWPSPTGPS